MSKPQFRSQSATHFVSVYDSSTRESGFFDVTYGAIWGRDLPVMRHRVTASEASAIIGTEIGVGYGNTLENIERSIIGWSEANRRARDAEIRASLEQGGPIAAVNTILDQLGL